MPLGPSAHLQHFGTGSLCVERSLDSDAVSVLRGQSPLTVTALPILPKDVLTGPIPYVRSDTQTRRMSANAPSRPHQPHNVDVRVILAGEALVALMPVRRNLAP